MIRKITMQILEFISSIALVALVFAVIDSIVSGIYPQFNGVMVYKFSEFFPRSFCIYFLYMIPFVLLAVILYPFVNKLPPLKGRKLKTSYFTVGGAITIIIPILLFEIPNKLDLSYFHLFKPLGSHFLSCPVVDYRQTVANDCLPRLIFCPR